MYKKCKQYKESVSAIHVSAIKNVSWHDCKCKAFVKIYPLLIREHKICTWHQDKISNRGVLPFISNTRPGHLQSTAEVPLRLAPKPQMFRAHVCLKLYVSVIKKEIKTEFPLKESIKHIFILLLTNLKFSISENNMSLNPH